MPCYDPRNNSRTITEYRSGISPEQLEKAIDETNKLAGILCAIVNELDRRDILFSVAAEASRNGLIDVMPWINKHKDEDTVRLAKELHRYSKDEQAVLKKLLSS